MKEMNKSKVENFWMDPSLFIFHGQEKVKHSLGITLFVVAKLALWIIGHDSKDCQMTKIDFKIYLTQTSMHAIFHATIQNCP
jgi:hypothetical protein